METLTIPLVFLAGVASFASPCFLPIVPVFMASLLGIDVAETRDVKPIPALAAASGRDGFLVPVSVATQAGHGGGWLSDGKSVSGFAGRDSEPFENQGPEPRQTPSLSMGGALLNALVFVAAFTAVFVAFWFAMATLGFAVGGFKTYLRIGGGALLIVLGLYLAGLLSIPALDKVWRAQGGSAGEVGLGRSAMMGLGFAAGWSPCIGPVLGAVIGLALTQGTMAQGLGLMLVYSIGLGLPFVLLAGGATGLISRLSWFTRNARVVQIISGALLMVVGFLMITDLLGTLSGVSWFGV